MERLEESNVDSLLFRARCKGVRIWVEKNELRYQAPKGVLNSDDYSKLKERRADLLEFLGKSPVADSWEGSIIRRASSEQVPLTFSQQAIWNYFNPGERGSRSEQFAVRLLGEWSIEVLRQAFAALVRRHEALRTRIVTTNGIPIQEIDEGDEFDVELVEITGNSKWDREASAKRFIAKLANAHLDVSAQPLFAVRLLELDRQDMVLVVSWDHLFFDPISIATLWRELWTTYSHLVTDGSIPLIEVPVQFGDYAVWQQKTNGSWMREHAAYLSERIAESVRVPLFSRRPIPQSADRPAFHISSVRLEKQLVNGLAGVSRENRVTLGMSLLTVYAALLLRWCNKSDLLVGVVTSGRNRTEIENTIGYFASTVFVHVTLKEADSFRELLGRVSKEYKFALHHDDSARTIARVPLPACALNAMLNWAPREIVLDPVTSFNAHVSQKIGITVERFAVDCVGVKNGDQEQNDFDDQDADPQLTLVETDEGVTGSMLFRCDQIATDSVDHFLSTFKHFAQILCSDPSTMVTSLPYQSERGLP